MQASRFGDAQQPSSPRVRAERRVAEIGGDVDEVESVIIERDRKDSSRADSPLVEANGAVVVDTSGLSITDVVDSVLRLLTPSPGSDDVAG